MATTGQFRQGSGVALLGRDTLINVRNVRAFLKKLSDKYMDEYPEDLQNLIANTIEAGKAAYRDQIYNNTNGWSITPGTVQFREAWLNSGGRSHTTGLIPPSRVNPRSPVLYLSGALLEAYQSSIVYVRESGSFIFRRPKTVTVGYRLKPGEGNPKPKAPTNSKVSAFRIGGSVTSGTVKVKYPSKAKTFKPAAKPTDTFVFTASRTYNPIVHANNGLDFDALKLRADLLSAFQSLRSGGSPNPLKGIKLSK